MKKTLQEEKSKIISLMEGTEQINEIGINVPDIANKIIIEFLNSLVGNPDFRDRAIEIAYESTHQGEHAKINTMIGWKENTGSSITRIADKRLKQIIDAIYKIPEY